MIMIGMPHRPCRGFSSIIGLLLEAIEGREGRWMCEGVDQHRRNRQAYGTDLEPPFLPRLERYVSIHLPLYQLPGQEPFQVLQMRTLFLIVTSMLPSDIQRLADTRRRSLCFGFAGSFLQVQGLHVKESQRLHGDSRPARTTASPFADLRLDVFIADIAVGWHTESGLLCERWGSAR
jgi:hypothetical protein